MDENWVRVLVTILGMVVSNLATIKVLRAQIDHHEAKLKEFKDHTREDIRQLFSKVNVTMTRTEIESLVRSCTGDTNRLIKELSKDFRDIRDDVVQMRASHSTNKSGFSRRSTD